jgi:hypothetical protein
VEHGLDGIAFRGIGNIVKKYGYKTIFVQSSKRRSYRLDSVSGASCFHRYNSCSLCRFTEKFQKI